MKFDGPLLNQRWRLGPRLGAGSQAHTYLARDERAGRDERIVVIKQLHLKKAGWKNFDLYEREVRVLNNLRHPGIPRFIDSFESEPGVFNLVMARMSGATLRAIATKVQFTDDELRDVLARCLEILDYLHRRDPPVIHRDIKPANIVRDAQGNIALVDFGGVRDALRESGGSTVIGTFGYMAPEQLHGQATPATDIYGLGATIVALAGRVEPENVPRRGLRMDLQAHLKAREPALLEILQAMTDPDPDKRPQSARAVSKMLGKGKRRRAKEGAKDRAKEGAKDRGKHRGKHRSGAALRRADSDALAKLRPAKPTPFDEIGDMLNAVPRPVDTLLRIVLLAFSIGGVVTVAVLQSVLLPLVFALVKSAAGSKGKRKIEATRSEITAALDEGRQGFRSLQERCMRRPKPPQLPD